MNHAKVFQLIESKKTELMLLIRKRIRESAVEMHDANDLYRQFISLILLAGNSVEESDLLDRAELAISSIIAARDMLYEETLTKSPNTHSTGYELDTRLDEISLDDLLVIINANPDATKRLLLKLYYHGTFKYNLVESDVVGGKKWLHLGIDRLDALNDYLESQKTGRGTKLSLNFISGITHVPSGKIQHRVKWQVIREILDIIYAYKRYVK
jgi:hypothetical protein